MNYLGVVGALHVQGKECTKDPRQKRALQPKKSKYGQYYDATEIEGKCTVR
jgi:hypothetical protein